jgi:hypothetical protein
MNGIIFEQMCIGRCRTQIIDRNHFNIVPSMLDDGTQNQTANPAKPIDRDAHAHIYLRSKTTKSAPFLACFAGGGRVLLHPAV